jgi:hypothetical protein
LANAGEAESGAATAKASTAIFPRVIFITMLHGSLSPVKDQLEKRALLKNIIEAEKARPLR